MVYDEDLVKKWQDRIKEVDALFGGVDEGGGGGASAAQPQAHGPENDPYIRVLTAFYWYLTALYNQL